MPKSISIAIFAIAAAILLLLAGSLVMRHIRKNATKNYSPPVKNREDLKPILEDIIRRYGQPAMGCALVRGKGLFIDGAAGVKVLGGDTPVDTNSRFHIGSTTKSMTALLTAMLCKEGKLRYDMTLEEALPGIPMLEAYKKATLHDLLLHRAGIMPFQSTEMERPEHVQYMWYDLPATWPDPTEQRREMTRFVLSLEPVKEPGSTPVYSNVGYGVLGFILETAAGKPYEALLNEKIFTPLGMTSAKTGKWPASLDEPDQPRGHIPSPGAAPLPQELDDPYVFPDWANPAGGVHCTIHDFALYAGENLAGLQGKGVLLDQKNYERIHSAHIKANIKEMYPGMQAKGSIPLGYGWGVLADAAGNISTADGSGGTFYATLIIYPGLDMAFAGFTNSGDGKPALNEAIRKLTGFKWE